MGTTTTTSAFGVVVFCFFLLLVEYCRCADIGKHFTRSPQSIVAPPGDRVTFQCETNIPAEQVRWKLNGRFLEANESDIRISGSFLVVKVAKVRERFLQQVGDYQCVANFGAESLTSLPAQLTIASLSPFPTQIQNRSLEVVEGNGVVAISCDPPYSNPPPVVQFWKLDR
ncbi:Interference hedgehog [Folsomia candida]|uniref:Interference hedgehog n=1 Tax=Folsomia candida TaxID=158441 RepID=A0A226EPD6_FOLCA|nr:Interference hedgehog [Folsomia candida]